MQDRIPVWLHDVLKAIALLRQFREGRSREDLDKDALFKSAVERQLSIVGEALGRAASLAPDLKLRISDFRQIVSLRNILIHSYANVRSDLLWPLFDVDLPRLEGEVKGILDSWKSTP